MPRTGVSIPDTNLGKWVNWLAALFGIVVLLRDYLHLAPDWSAFITYSAVSLLLVFFVAASILREFRAVRTTRLVIANEKWHRCQHILRNLNTFLIREVREVQAGEKVNFEDIRRQVQAALSEVLTEIASAYSFITGAKCRATIKAVYQVENKAYVYAVARDRESQELSYADDLKRCEENADPIEENDDFLLLYFDYGPAQRFFLCNDLSAMRNYHSSSFKVYGKPAVTFDLKDRIFERFRGKKNWPLPYTSTVVWPIQQRETPGMNLDFIACLGFLALDCQVRNAFSETWDFPIGAAIADSMLIPLRLLTYLARKHETA